MDFIKWHNQPEQSFTLQFGSYSDVGIPMFAVRDKDGVDPVGELIFIDDDFTLRNKCEVVSHPPIDYHAVVLGMLNIKNNHTARLVVGEVFEHNNSDDLLEVDFFKECASLVIGERNIYTLNK